MQGTRRNPPGDDASPQSGAKRRGAAAPKASRAKRRRFSGERKRASGEGEHREPSVSVASMTSTPPETGKQCALRQRSEQCALRSLEPGTRELGELCEPTVSASGSAWHSLAKKRTLFLTEESSLLSLGHHQRWWSVSSTPGSAPYKHNSANVRHCQEGIFPLLCRGICLTRFMQRQ